MKHDTLTLTLTSGSRPSALTRSMSVSLNDSTNSIVSTRSLVASHITLGTCDVAGPEGEGEGVAGLAA